MNDDSFELLVLSIRRPIIIKINNKKKERENEILN